MLSEGIFEGRDCYQIEAGDARYWYTKQLGYLARTSGDKTVRLAAPPEDWQWPLQVGKQWSATVTWTDKGEQERTFVLTGVWLVETYEEVKTPAGTFKAFKVSRREVESGASQEFWYSPEARGWVKIRGTEHRRRQLRGRADRLHRALILSAAGSPAATAAGAPRAA